MSETSDISIAILLTTFNRYKVTLKCLTALEESVLSRNVHFQIYLTDDSSPDNTGSLVKEKFRGAKVFYSDGKSFWNRGMINSWSEALKDKHDYYLLLNDDVALRPDAIQEMLDMYLENSVNTVVIGRTYLGELSNITYGGLERRSFLSKFAFRIAPVNSDKVCTFNANCVLIPESGVNAVGILDPYYSHQFGDIDLGLRFWQEKWNLLQVPIPVAELARNLPYPHGNGFMKWSDIKFLFTHPKGLPYREVWHFYRKFGGLEIYLYFPMRYIKIFSKLFFKFLR